LPGTSSLLVLALADEPPHRPVAQLVEAIGPQAILLLGDLDPAWTDGLAAIDLPKLGVRGNHDAPDALTAVGAEDLHLRHVEVDGLSFAGLGGSPRYSPAGGNQWTEEQAEEMLARLPGAEVLLTHSPPAGVNDEPDDRAHRGSPALRAWVDAHQPRWLLHGHTLPDPARAVSQVGPTRVAHVRGAVPFELA
jgi:Icc-related predicted phosphoesterase